MFNLSKFSRSGKILYSDGPSICSYSSIITEGKYLLFKPASGQTIRIPFYGDQTYRIQIIEEFEKAVKSLCKYEKYIMKHEY